MKRNALSRRQFAAGALGTAASLSFRAGLARANPQSGPHLMAAAAETIVTPTATGTFLIGPMKASTGVHDDLYARALVLADGPTHLAIVTIDFLGFDFAYNDTLIAAISGATDILPQHIIINCSHNHNAPITAPWGPWEEKKDKPWHKTLPEKLSRIVRQAAGRLKPATVRYRREPVQIGFNRRLPTSDGIVMAPNPSGVVAPWADVLSVNAVEGGPIATLFSHAAHPVIVHAASTLISADYPGFAVRTLRQSLGQDGVFLFAQGCGGNINGFPLQGGIDAAAAAGRDLGRAVIRAVNAPGDALQSRRLRAISHEVALPLQAPPPVTRCREMLAQEKDPATKERLTELLAAAERGKPRTMRFPIRAFAFGDQLCLLGLPHEMFAEYQHFVDEISPFRHNMVLAYTNGDECYVGMDKDYRLGDRGGYETSPMGAALMYGSRLALAPESEGHIKAGVKSVLQRLTAA